MPAAKTLEQLTAKYQEFRSLGSIQSWSQLHNCRALLQRIDQEIAQQKNVAKREGLQLVKLELQANSKEAKGRLPRETRFGKALDGAEEGTAATAIAYAQSVKRQKTETRLQAALMAQQTGHNRDAVAVGRALRAGAEDEELSAADDDAPEAPVDAPEALVDAPAPKARAKAKGKAKAKAKAASAPASSGGIRFGGGIRSSGGIRFGAWVQLHGLVR